MAPLFGTHLCRQPSRPTTPTTDVLVLLMFIDLTVPAVDYILLYSMGRLAVCLCWVTADADWTLREDLFIY